MGMFSFKTQDTNKSISNIHSERETFKVIMTDNKGNQYTETAYDGYGDFGNVDFYALTDIMNGGNGDRERGIKIYFDKQYISKKYIFPSLSESGKYYNGKRPDDCNYQGYFYDDFGGVY